jgi:hypothetical protein
LPFLKFDPVCQSQIIEAAEGTQHNEVIYPESKAVNKLAKGKDASPPLIYGVVDVWEI